WKRHGDPLKLGSSARPAEDRFLERVQRTPEGCLEWTAGRSTSGYGLFAYNGTNGYAHRYAWIREHGEIPEGMFIDHICHNPLCVAVEHLRMATKAENTYNHSGPSRG